MCVLQLFILLNPSTQTTATATAKSDFFFLPPKSYFRNMFHVHAMIYIQTLTIKEKTFKKKKNKTHSHTQITSICLMQNYDKSCMYM